MTQQILVVDNQDVCQGGIGAEYLIDYQVWGDGSPVIVLLHDGLGSVAQWRSTPQAIAERCGVAVLAYNRPGHGQSQPVPDRAWPTGWLHHQAELLGLLLSAWNIENPLLVGHSDGASIALLWAAGEGAGPDQLSARCRGVVSLAAHSFVEPICGTAIAELQADKPKMHAALKLFHRHPEALFAAWTGVWLSDEFSSWDIRSQLGTIDVPTWIIQGDRDEYGTGDQLRTTNDAIGAKSKAILVPDVGHLMHHEDQQLVVDLVVDAMSDT